MKKIKIIVIVILVFNFNYSQEKFQQNGSPNFKIFWNYLNLNIKMDYQRIISGFYQD